jgi:hypothetical protein
VSFMVKLQSYLSRHRIGSRRRWANCFAVVFFFLFPAGSVANDWIQPSHQLAQKIAAVTGPGAVVVVINNRSTLGKKDVDVIGSAVMAELEAFGVHPVPAEQAAASVDITLSDNPQFHVWVAQVHQGTADPAVVIVSLPRADEIGVVHDSFPMNLRKILLWAQENQILDVAALDENSAPQYIAVLDGEKLAIYRQRNGKWQTEQNMSISHSHPWPRDLRGLLLPAKDHLFDVYLPGVFCQTSTAVPLNLSCRESDDPWPLPNAGGGQPLHGFYAASRNFFTGDLTPGVGKLTNVGKFYSAAVVPRPNYLLWLFTGMDGQVHLVDGVTEQAEKLRWGSDMVSVRTGCGAGWQIVATAADAAQGDSLRAYEIADRDPAPVTAGLDFPGDITALWPDVKYDSAIAIVREKGQYEAFRVAVDCGE